MPSSTPGANAWTVLRGSGHLSLFLVLCLGVWLQATNTTLIATLLPSAIPNVGGAHLIGWAFTVYLVGSIVAATAAALSVRRIGLRACLVMAAGLYAAGCVIAAAAPRMELLLVGRVVQGYGGGTLLAATLIAIDALFPNAIMPRLMSWISAIWSVATFTGPLVGGLFATYADWRGAFWAFAVVSIVFGLLAAALTAGIRLPTPETNARLPVRRLALLAAGILLIALGSADVDALTTPVLIIAGTVALIAFLRLDGRSGASRMLPPNPLDPRTPSGAGLIMIFLLGIGTMSFAVFGPFLMVRLYDATPLVAGFMVAFESASWGLMALLVGGAAQRWEPTLIRAGATMVMIYIIWMCVVVPTGPLWLIAPGAFLAGAGFGTMYGFVVRRIVNAAQTDERDRAAGAIPMVQQTSYALAGAICGLIANAVGFSDTMSDDTARTVGFWVFAAFIPCCAAGWLAALRVARH